MRRGKFDIYVFADWLGLNGPVRVGVLSAHFAKAKKAFSFTYDRDWLDGGLYKHLDPDIGFYSGPQYPVTKENFGIFLDSMPDTWGKTLMKRREAQNARQRNQKPRTLYDIDYLLGVYDKSRMGALRFKTDANGPFLDNDDRNPTPPWSSLGELQKAVEQLESDTHNEETRQWLEVLIAPGASLGGARPKANILGRDKRLWIAKFPSISDTFDKAAWEFIAYRLALASGIKMVESKLEIITGRHHTFLTQRFDRCDKGRIHFASAMTMTGNNEENLRNQPASYLDIVDVIERYGNHVTANLHQLWRRIVFNIAISNTDDHLRNHGFLLNERGWELSPAYDLNPSIDKSGLALNISMDDNALDFELAKSVGEFFRLREAEMNNIIDEVMNAVKNWRTEAKTLGLKSSEIELMAPAFQCVE